MAEVFPESILPIYPVTITPIWQTITSRFDGGGEQRRQKQLYATYDVSLKFTALSGPDAQTLWAFYMARKGAAQAFWFYDPAPSIGITTTHAGLYVGAGDGSTDIFDLPGKSTSARTIYLGGVEETGLSYLTGGGDGNADRVDFTSAPAAGQIITVDFTGVLRIRARFAIDRLSRELFMTVLFNFGIQLKGLSPA